MLIDAYFIGQTKSEKKVCRQSHKTELKETGTFLVGKKEYSVIPNL